MDFQRWYERQRELESNTAKKENEARARREKQEQELCRSWELGRRSKELTKAHAWFTRGMLVFALTLAGTQGTSSIVENYQAIHDERMASRGLSRTGERLHFPVPAEHALSLNAPRLSNAVL